MKVSFLILMRMMSLLFTLTDLYPEKKGFGFQPQSEHNKTRVGDEDSGFYKNLWRLVREEERGIESDHVSRWEKWRASYGL